MYWLCAKNGWLRAWEWYLSRIVFDWCWSITFYIKLRGPFGMYFIIKIPPTNQVNMELLRPKCGFGAALIIDIYKNSGWVYQSVPRVLEDSTDIYIGYLIGGKGKQFYGKLLLRNIVCYKQLYKVGKVQKLQPILLYNILDRGFFTALVGYQMYKTAELKIDAGNFAKAAEKFGKIMGNDIVFKPDGLNYYKQHYQNEIDKSGYWNAYQNVSKCTMQTFGNKL